MSVITTHMISPVNPDFDLIGKLKEKNILIEKTIYRYNKNNEVVGRNSLIIDYTACDAAEAEANLLRIKYEQPETEEWDERVLNTLLTMPVSIRDAENGFSENTVFWFLNYRCDEMPAFYIAKAFPEEEFRYTEEMEGSIVCDLTIKDDKVITNHLEEAKEEERE